MQLNYYASLYQEQCSNFVENDHVQWPASSRNGVEEAQKVFSLQWDLLRIIQNWGDSETLLPNEYQYELYSNLLALSILIVIAAICFCLCFCQVFCIPEYKVFLRCCNVNIDPESKRQCEKYCLFFSLLVFGGLLCVVCGFSYKDEQIENSLLQIKCVSLWMIQSTIEKNALHAWQPNWDGVQEIDRKITVFNNTLQQSDVSLKQLTQLADIDEEDCKETLLKLYDKHRGDMLDNPDPFSERVQCDYIANLGPYTKIGTTSQLMYDELGQRDKALLLFQGIKNTSKHINENIQTISNKLNGTKIKLYDFTQKIIQFLSKIDDSINKQSWMINSGISGYKNYLLVIGITIIILIISFILVTWFRLQKLAFLLHISWISINILLLIGLGVLTFVYYIGLIDNNMVCVLADNITHNPDILTKIIHLEGHPSHLYQNKTFVEEIKVCLYHKGNLIKYFHLDNQFKQIELLNEYTTEVSEMVLTQDVLEEQINIISRYQKDYGLILPNADTILAEFNRYTDSGQNNSYQIDCQQSKDEWEWKSDKCLYYYGRSEFGMAVCLIFDDYDEQYAHKRYDGKFKKCVESNINGNIQDPIDQYYSSLHKYIKSVNQTFIPIMESLEEYQILLIKLDKNIADNSQNIGFYASQLNNLFVQQKELRVSMDCSYINEGAIRFKNTFCTTLLNGLFSMYLYLIAICFLLSIISLISVWSAMRCIPESEQHQVFQLASQNNFIITAQRRQIVQ